MALQIEVYRQKVGMAESFTDRFEKIPEDFFPDHLAPITEAIKSLQKECREILEQAKQVELEFGLQITGEAKALIVSAKTEATFTIRVVFEK